MSLNNDALREVDERADLSVLDYAPATPMTTSNVIDDIARAFSQANVRTSVGDVALRGRQLVSIDEGALALAARARPAASRLRERMQGYC